MQREIKQKAICIKSVDSGETDRIVTLLSPEYGIIRAKMKGVKKAKAKLAFASFPFFLGEYLLVNMGNSHTVTNCNFIENFANISTDINKYYAGSALLEVANVVVKENQENASIFVLLLKCLQALNYKQNVKIYTTLSKFLCDTIKLTGYGVGTDKNLGLERKVFFDFERGSLTNEQTEYCLQLAEKDAQSLNYILDTEINHFDFEHETSKTAFKILLQFFETQLDEELIVMRNFR